ncbi:MAG: glycosyltransferase family A protein [Bacilli bacterium]|nr:glycosyltransferase family A protein [Bacilli bacterium]
MKKNLKISIIIPVYNSEKYLEECIDSVISQDLDFKKNIELILVNDGSTDTSSNICRSYQNLFPENVIYIEKSNGGVSSARNEGVKNVTTKYFGFIDSDDYISKDSLSSVVNYFEENTIKSVVAIIKVMNIGAKTTPHPTNKKFKEKLLIHDLKNPKGYDVCPRVAPAFFRTEQTKNYKFDEAITLYEDTKYMSEIISDYPLVGVVNKGTYYYRRFEQDSDFDVSITTGITLNKIFYIQTLKNVTLAILEKKKEKPLMSKYLDYAALYTFRWILLYNTTDPKDILTESEFNEYITLQEKIFTLISISSITSFNLFNHLQKVYLLSLKQKSIILNNLRSNKNGDVLYKKEKVFNIKENIILYITKQYIENNILTIKGVINAPLTENIILKATIDDIDYQNIEVASDCSYEEKIKEQKPFNKPSFIVKLPLNETQKVIKFFIKTENESFQIEKLKRTKSNKKFKKAFILEKQYYLYRTTKSITVMKKNILNYTMVRLRQIRKKIKRKIIGR